MKDGYGKSALKCPAFEMILDIYKKICHILVSFVSSICPYPQFRELFNPKPNITVSFSLQKTGVMYKIFTFTHYTCFFLTIQNLFYFVDSFNTTS